MELAVVAPTMTTYHCNETLIHEIAHALDYAIRITGIGMPIVNPDSSRLAIKPT